MVKDKGTSTEVNNFEGQDFPTFQEVMGKKTEQQLTEEAQTIVDKIIPQDPNEKLFNFLEENNLDFTALPFTDNYVFVPGKGVIIFTSPQLIYRAKVKNGQ
jgi:hypothetical protein